jgi:uncharacterized protein (DUF934 family)
MNTGTEGGSQTLERQGWMRRFTAIGSRLAESVALYERLGFEVRLEVAEGVDPELANAACQTCAVTALARTIYTRPRQPSALPFAQASMSEHVCSSFDRAIHTQERE